MKKYLLMFISIICIYIMTTDKLHAVDITAGATTWYAWMKQYYKTQVLTNSKYDINNHSTWLYGPALSVKFNDDFNLTFIYLYGKFILSQRLMEGDFDDDSDCDYNFKRSDLDLAINYRLNDYFKVFSGIKYLSRKIDRIGTPPTINGYVHDVENKGYGPGLGISATYPITNNIFLLGTISGFYLWCKESKRYNPSISDPLETIKTDYNDYGINSGLSIAYYIAPVSTTISLGGRFQYIKADSDYDTSKFYGVTLTATYTFNI